MTDDRLPAFFARLDDVGSEQAGGRPLLEDDVGDEALNRAGDVMLPMFARLAERAGVDLDQLRDEIRDRVGVSVDAIARRLGDHPLIDAEVEIRAELTTLSTAAGMQFFLAGAVWEQDRQLPDLDLEIEP